MTTETTEPTTEPTEQQPTNREARYRRELRAAEGERDALRTQVEDLHRAEAERLSELEKPAAIWATGTTVGDLLGDDGQLDPEKVAAAAEAARSDLGAAPARKLPKPDMTQGAKGGDALPVDPFVAAFEPRR